MRRTYERIFIGCDHELPVRLFAVLGMKNNMFKELTCELTSWQHEAFHVTQPRPVRSRRQQPVGLRCEGRGGQRGWQDG